MSTPRRVVPGQTWFLTRRTVARFFLLNPDRAKLIIDLYWYITAVIALRYGIQLHAVQVLSTHIHEVVTDPRGQLPKFLRDRNRLFALTLKVCRGIEGAVFSGEPPSCVALYGEAAVIDKIAYTLANCVEAGLARCPEEWVGVTMSAKDVGTRTVRAHRPDFFFSATNSQWPEWVDLPITMPPVLTAAFASEGTARWILCQAVDSAVDAARKAVIMSGRSFSTPSRIFRNELTKRSKTVEPDRERNPTFATGGSRSESFRAIEQRRSFLESYRSALEKVKAGLSKVEFPFGTWRFCQELGFPMMSAA